MERGPKWGFRFGMGGPWRFEECHCGHPHGFHHVRWEWGCHGEGHMFFRRRFISREERIAWLERYLEALRQEMKAVEEHLADLKAKAQEE
ncbi:MAG: hypothetical protein H5T66_12985 [Chloroflexi bacterium]|nr:hypothetical protein [Chloroflexota bacterium]